MKNISTEKLLVTVGFALIAFFSLFPFFGIGFANDDDFQYFVTAHKSLGDWMTDAWIYAIGARRFYFTITKYFYYVPYLVDSFVYTKVVQYVSLSACYILFSYLIWRIFRIRQLSLIVLLLLFFNTVVLPYKSYMPTFNYPFYFTFSSMVFMSAILVYLNYREHGGRWRLLVSALFMLFSYLFYENYLLLSLFFFPFILLHHCAEHGVRQAWRQRAFWTEVLPYVAVVILYIGVYFFFQNYVATAYPDAVAYDGNLFNISQFSLVNFLRMCERCTRIALPGQSFFYYKNFMAETTLFVSGGHKSFGKILIESSTMVWVNALLQVVMLLWLTRGTWFRKLTWKQIVVGALSAVVVAFFSHTLVASAVKYNDVLAGMLRCYVTSFYSLLGLMAAFALIMAALLKIVKTQRGNRAVRLVLCLLMLVMSLVIGYSNENISREYKKSHRLLTVLDAMAQDGYFDTLPDDAILYTLPLHNSNGISYNDSESERNIEHYLCLRAGRNLITKADWDGVLQMKKEKAGSPIYYFYAQAAQHSGDVMVAVSVIDDDSIDAGCSANHTDVFYISADKDCTVFYRTNDGWRASPMAAEDKRKAVSHIAIDSHSIDPASIRVSNMAH